MTNYPTEDVSPLSRLINDDNLVIMEKIIPHCPPSIGRFLAVTMKLTEIQKIINGFEDSDRLSACGFEDSPRDIETILASIRNSVSGEKAEQIDQILSLIRFSKFYEKYREIIQEHPELMPSPGPSAAEKSQEPSPFSDPSLFFLLNSMMNNSEGMQDDKLKQMMEIAKAAGSEHKDMGELLSALLKSKG
ncbi:MAG: hypothetical protein MR867_05195 [Eubacterium sp.]|nr:hypothetical protein [Eubacterium sp.]MDD7210315.1 hypothetical protein [Lachnospiraceae bacterium]MDY5496869.1 hypothetical protein [Anaerobutyricum sp.]